MIQLINFWKDSGLTKFKLSFEKLIVRDVYLFSVFGTIDNIYKYNDKKKILLIGENIERDKYSIYKNHDIIKQFDLVLGFKYLNYDNYLRFPIWLYHNSYFINELDKYLSFIVNHQKTTTYNINNKKMACLISRTDINNLRVNLLKTLKIKIDCPSSIGKNCESIEKQKLSKIEFMKKYIFNICPENGSSEGYTTEKLFECVFANCIPIYYGTLGEEEKQIFNLNRIIFIDINNLDKVNKIIDDLVNNNKLEEFYNQSIFNLNSEKIIVEFINKFKLKLNNL